MPTIAETSTDAVSSFIVKNEEFVVIPQKEFRRLKQLDEYPKLYTEEDEE